MIWNMISHIHIFLNPVRPVVPGKSCTRSKSCDKMFYMVKVRAGYIWVRFIRTGNVAKKFVTIFQFSMLSYVLAKQIMENVDQQ